METANIEVLIVKLVNRIRVRCSRENLGENDKEWGNRQREAAHCGACCGQVNGISYADWDYMYQVVWVFTNTLSHFSVGYIKTKNPFPLSTHGRTNLRTPTGSCIQSRSNKSLQRVLKIP